MALSNHGAELGLPQFCSQTESGTTRHMTEGLGVAFCKAEPNMKNVLRLFLRCRPAAKNGMIYTVRHFCMCLQCFFLFLGASWQVKLICYENQLVEIRSVPQNKSSHRPVNLSN